MIAVLVAADPGPRAASASSAARAASPRTRRRPGAGRRAPRTADGARGTAVLPRLGRGSPGAACQPAARRSPSRRCVASRLCSTAATPRAHPAQATTQPPGRRAAHGRVRPRRRRAARGARRRPPARGPHATTAASRRRRPGVRAPVVPDDDRPTRALITVVPAAAPTAEATESWSHDHPRAAAHDGAARATVTGTTAVSIDVAAKLNDALPIYLAIVVGLAFVLLMLVFRSLLVPLKASLGFLLSVGASLGAIVAVFQWGWLAGRSRRAHTGPDDEPAPILLIGILFGLAMDYEVFLVSRMREAHVHGATPREAVVTGFRHAAPVVVAAAAIMSPSSPASSRQATPPSRRSASPWPSASSVDAFIVRMIAMPGRPGAVGERGLVAAAVAALAAEPGRRGSRARARRARRGARAGRPARG